ncbi:MAG: 4-hydroxy-3-methylbut-2-enyl diphosphate reductase [Myxococcota bacterium]|nr:4-hydroxy-3-methylbut-2-enyl diphosphate reductase [Myxococcota bacterium]
MKIILASPRGFCAGVDRAIEIVERALSRSDQPVYVRHEIVHNRHVVEGLREKGAIFIDDPEEAPEKSELIYSAHGVSPEIRQRATDQKLRTIDATCPLVTKVHNEVQRMSREGLEIIMIGHAGHVEVEGTMGQAPGQMHLVQSIDDVPRLQIADPTRLGCVTQTTLSVDDTREIMDALRQKFPQIVLPRRDDICYATQNRQDAVKQLAEKAQLVLVVGAPESSNSNRLVEVASRMNVSSHLITSAIDIEPEWLKNVTCVGVTAGASTPEFLVDQVIERLVGLSKGAEVSSLPEIDEGMHFKLPADLRP